MTNHRLFFAIELSPECKTQLLNLQHHLSEIKGIPIAAENLHITLSFLGDVNDKKLDAILDGFNAPAISPFNIVMRELTFWPKQKVFALALTDPQQQLTRLKKNIDKQLSQLNFFQVDKKAFIPHITLYRQVEQIPNQLSPVNGEIPVTQISLIQSTLTKNGSKYTVIDEWALENPSIKSHLTGF